MNSAWDKGRGGVCAHGEWYKQAHVRAGAWAVPSPARRDDLEVAQHLERRRVQVLQRWKRDGVVHEKDERRECVHRHRLSVNGHLDGGVGAARGARLSL